VTKNLPVLQCGHCEPLKIVVHGTALALAGLCGIYNAAAWLSRREPHLAVNTILYLGLTIWEQQHVAHHIAAMQKTGTPVLATATPAPVDEGAAAPPAPTDLAA